MNRANHRACGDSLSILNPLGFLSRKPPPLQAGENVTVAELFDAWLTEHDRQLLAKTETEAGKRISSELKLEHASDAHARTDPSRAYIQGCKAARSLLEDAIRDMTQEQGTL